MWPHLLLLVVLLLSAQWRMTREMLPESLGCQSREQKPVGLSPESESSLSTVALPPLLRPFK